MKILKIETDKWENLTYAEGEPNKRSVQFRILADKINEIIDRSKDLSLVLGYIVVTWTIFLIWCIIK